MALTKIIDGKRIKYTEEEEKEQIAKWKANEVKQLLRKERKQQKLDKIAADKSEVMKKLNLTEEEFDCLKNSLN